MPTSDFIGELIRRCLTKKGIAVAGSLIVDKHHVIAAYPEEGCLMHISEQRSDIGGTGNLIIDLAKLDDKLPVKVSAILGRDGAGKTVTNCFARYPNIDTSNINRTGQTSETLVMNAQNTKQRTFFYFPAASDMYSEEYIDWDILDADIFHLEYLLLMKKVDAQDPVYGTHAAKILAEAQRKGMKTSVDAVSEKGPRVKPIIRAALKYTDFCIINELEAQEATGIRLEQNDPALKKNAKQALKKLADWGVRSWVIIHSALYSFGLDCKTSNAYALASLNLPAGYIKGKTGAGDAFCAGVLYEAYKEQSVIEAMKTGTACAACSLSELNGTDGMRPYNEVRSLYEYYKGSDGYETL